MKFYSFLICFYISVLTITAQNITGQELLEKSIHYHDPQGNWNTFNGSLHVTMKTPKGSDRVSKIEINLPEEYFSVQAKRDTVQTTYTMDKGKCRTTITDSISKPSRRTPCEMAELYKNYYTYLYGLPMKLKDPGTSIDNDVKRLTFKGKEYLVLRVHYDAKVGTDFWQFYFDPTTYAMEVYQFFKGNPEGKGENTGEYILLTDIKTIRGIKFPKNRAWYYNKNDGYLGTDLLQ